MSHTITVRIPDDLDDWLRAAAREMGVPMGRLVREQLERAREQDSRAQPFMRLAGKATGPRNLSTRKGFSKS